ncbi:MAG: hypothetical protein WC943_02990, partial [Elusimicrobiota bacterium]
RRFAVSFELKGSQPNRSYTVGAHFFEPKGRTVQPVSRFAGWKVGDARSELSREGVAATCVGGWDFARLDTDQRGDGTADFEALIPPGEYFIQFTVRAGRCRPSQGVTEGCAAVYRTGGKLGKSFEVVSADGGSAVERHETALTPGWDVFDAPLRQGRVRWTLGEAGQGRKRFTAAFELKGAQPRHSYTVGAHFFEPKGTTVKPVTSFGGWKVGDDKGELTRDGITAMLAGGWDFGTLTTDEKGDGAFEFDSLIPAEDFYLQYTIRTGRCRPSEGVTDGCAAVYRSGGKLGAKLEKLSGRSPAAD